MAGPVDVDLVGGEAEVFGDAEGEEVLLARGQAGDEFVGGEALVSAAVSILLPEGIMILEREGILFICNGHSNIVEADGIEHP